MSGVERNVSPKPEQMPDILKGREKLTAFWHAACKLGIVASVLDERSAGVIGALLAPPFPILDELRDKALVTTRQSVRRIIVSGITRIHPLMPPDVRKDHPLEELVKLGPNRTRLSEAGKRQMQSPEARAKISKDRMGKGERKPETIKLDSQVVKLRKQGLTNQRIAKQLNRNRVAIQNSVQRLIAAGRLERRKGGRKPKTP